MRSHLNVCIVEDNATIRESLVGTLEELTCLRAAAIWAAEDEARAWLATHSDGWDLLLVDLFLQSGSGMSLLQDVGRRNPRQKVVVFSNYVNAGVRKRCAQLGVDAVFDKSTEIDALLDYCARECARLAAQLDPAGA